jgi:hypothetical protein
MYFIAIDCKLGHHRNNNNAKPTSCFSVLPQKLAETRLVQRVSRSRNNQYFVSELKRLEGEEEQEEIYEECPRFRGHQCAK